MVDDPEELDTPRHRGQDGVSVLHEDDARARLDPPGGRPVDRDLDGARSVVDNLQLDSATSRRRDRVLRSRSQAASVAANATGRTSPFTLDRALDRPRDAAPPNACRDDARRNLPPDSTRRLSTES